MGYLETADNVYFFATNVAYSSPVPATWVAARRKITEDILREMKLIKNQGVNSQKSIACLYSATPLLVALT